MANYKTGAQRYNDKMHKIFARAKELNIKYHGVDHFGSRDTETKKQYAKRHSDDLLASEVS